MNAYVNLIPYNETENIGFKRSPKEQIMKFYDTLKKEKIEVTIRKEFGGKIDAACGQLRAKKVETLKIFVSVDMAVTSVSIAFVFVARFIYFINKSFCFNSSAC